jgi:hypothetical protein
MRYAEFNHSTGKFIGFWENPRAGALCLSDAGYKELRKKLTKQNQQINLEAIAGYSGKELGPSEIKDYFVDAAPVKIEVPDASPEKRVAELETKVAELESMNAAMLLALVEGGML